MPHRDVIVMGASSGGIEVLREIVHRLPGNLPAAILVVIHVSPAGPALLPAILGRAGPLPAALSVDGDRLEYGRINVAPPNRHLLVEDNHIRLGDGPRENGFRPAVDPLFRSAAMACGPRTIGVILSGAMDDGTAGLAAIKEYGGTAVVQDPKSAMVKAMPRSAIRNVPVDYVLDAGEIAPILIRLTSGGVDDVPTIKDPPLESEVAMSNMPDSSAANAVALATRYTPRCPDCGGPMREIDGPQVLRFRCHEGHAFTAGSLMAKQADQNLATLRETVSSTREQAELGRRLAERAAKKGDLDYAQFVGGTAVRLEQRAEVLQQVIDASEADPDPAE